MSKTLAWGIIGTGRIAHTFARELPQSAAGKLTAVGSRTQASADRFGQELGLSPRHCHGSYEALLADREVEAVYISTPHPMHAEWAVKAAEAGKHILCEKPITLNYPEAMAVVEAARGHDVFLMEAFMYRCHPQTAKLVELIREKAIGEVRLVQASFSFHAPFNLESRLFNKALGGGGILDVGCYTMSLARLVAGAAAGKDFAEPIEVKATAHIGEASRVDEYAVASLKFPEDILAQVATGVGLRQESVVRIFGTEGWIFVPVPWFPARAGSSAFIRIERYGEEPREVRVESAAGIYALEADVVASNLERRQAAPPAMTWEDSLGNMSALDRWRESIGLVYDQEKPEAVPTVTRRPLAVRKDSKMSYGRIEGVDKQVSRLVMGVVHRGKMLYSAVMYDDYFERGGNCFDNAYVYGAGECERILGQWIRNRGIRDQVVILDKGAHSPFCTPEHLTRQLLESLDRLGSDHIDIYMMHRDNLEIPVGEFVEVLNEHKQAGRIRAFGGSNWSIGRIEAANEYARSKGITGFSAVSNQFSLARMIQPPWLGCLAASDAESRAWLARTRLPLMPWSSQARGFFAGSADPDDRSNQELVRCWYSEDNFKRLERAKELARKYDALPINIALAYVLRQPFPTFPIIGPQSLGETAIAFRGLELELTPEELRWLDFED
jgi:predicted dehydrogenase/aryl-alcohol dehydrogenase-like predicted oxidoreductase